MPFLLAEILNFQGSTHRIGVGSFSNIFLVVEFNNPCYTNYSIFLKKVSGKCVV